ncbi:MAG: alpha/beta hydrolase [Bacteroidetes bacterium]|nr:alpha/beta hydrolase [Bacteroidota bacterium]
MEPTTIITTDTFPALSFRKAGSGPALMLLHGFPASGTIWEPLIPLLAETHTLLIPDIPGSGQSQLGKPLPTIEELATLVPAILEHTGIERCVLVGHSMGGYIALAAAETFPEKLNGLMLVHSTALADDAAKKDKRLKSIGLIQKGGREAFIRGMVPALFAPDFCAANPEQIVAFQQEGLRLSDTSMIAFYNAMMNRPDRRQVLSKLPFPAAWFLGAMDGVIPWETCLQQSSLPRVTFISLNKTCGHMGMIEQPEALSAQLAAFSEICRQWARQAS